MAKHAQDGVIVDGPMVFPIRPTRAAEGYVFVTLISDDGEQSWMAIHGDQAELAHLNVIRCSRCQRPAAQLDHCWPYEDATTLCAEHVEAYREEQRQANRELRERLRRLPAVEEELAEAKARIAELQGELERATKRTELAELSATAQRCKCEELEAELDAVLPRCAVCGKRIPKDAPCIIEVATDRRAHAYCEAGFKRGLEAERNA